MVNYFFSKVVRIHLQRDSAWKVEDKKKQAISLFFFLM
jgi:hypothetical protein